MRFFAAFLPSLLIITYFADCPCGEKGIAVHKRVHIKDRSMSNEDAVPFTFSKVYKLKITTNQLTRINKDGELILPNEKKIIELTGYIRILKESPDDCDIHIELAATKDPVANRIIAEVPNTEEYCGLREEIYRQLKEKYGLEKKKTYSFDKTTLPKIRVYGYVFFDNGHPTGHNHGSKFVKTIWEVHPVFMIDWL